MCQCINCGVIKEHTKANFRSDKGKVGECCWECRIGATKNNIAKKELARDSGKGPSQKSCLVCKETKAISDFHWHGQTADGYDNRCSECYNKQKRDSESKKPKREHVLSTMIGQSQTCRECSVTGPVEDFYFRRGKVTDLCKECLSKRAYCKKSRDLQRLKDPEGYLAIQRERQRQFRENNPEWYKAFFEQYRKSTNYKVSLVKQGSLKRRIEMEMDEEEIADLFDTNKECFYCGGGNTSDSGLGIDRLNSERGYSVDNVVVCCTFCNVSKNCLDVVSFVQLCYYVAEFAEDENHEILKARQWKPNEECFLCGHGTTSLCNRCRFMYKLNSKTCTKDTVDFIRNHASNVVAVMGDKWQLFTSFPQGCFISITPDTTVSYVQFSV